MAEIYQYVKVYAQITIPGAPVTKKNHSRIVTAKNGKPFLLPSKEFEEYQKKAGYYIKPDDRKKKIDFSVNVQCLYYMPTKRRVDLVNLLGATDDILVHYGVLEDDKSNIVFSHDGSRVLLDRENPRVEIEISEAIE